MFPGVKRGDFTHGKKKGKIEDTSPTFFQKEEPINCSTGYRLLDTNVSRQ